MLVLIVAILRHPAEYKPPVFEEKKVVSLAASELNVPSLLFEPEPIINDLNTRESQFHSSYTQD